VSIAWSYVTVPNDDPAITDGRPVVTVSQLNCSHCIAVVIYC